MYSRFSCSRHLRLGDHKLSVGENFDIAMAFDSGVARLFHVAHDRSHTSGDETKAAHQQA